jgi:hypothetical protein
MPTSPDADPAQSETDIRWLSQREGAQAPESWFDPTTNSSWAVSVHWADINGVATPVGVDVRSFGPDGPVRTGLAEVTRGVLHRLPVATIIEGSLDRAIWLHLAKGGTTETDAASSRALLAADDRVDRRRGRPHEHSDAHYQEVARLYREALALGPAGRRKPAKYVETQLLADRKRVDSPDQVRKWIAEARRRGYLPAAQPRSKID